MTKWMMVPILALALMALTGCDSESGGDGAANADGDNTSGTESGWAIQLEGDMDIPEISGGLTVAALPALRGQGSNGAFLSFQIPPNAERVPGTIVASLFRVQAENETYACAGGGDTLQLIFASFEPVISVEFAGSVQCWEGVDIFPSGDDGTTMTVTGSFYKD